MSVTPTSKSKSAVRTWGLRIGGTALFVALLVWLDLRGDLKFDDIFATLGKANIFLVALSILLYMAFVTVKAARWRLVSRDMGMPMTWGQAWRIYAIGLAAGTFTPGQAGDALKAWYLQRMGYGLGRGLGSSLLDRLFDVAALALLGLLGVAVYGGKFAGQTPALIGLTLLCLAVVAFFAYNRTRQWAVNLVMRRLARTRDQGSGNAEQSKAWSLRRETLLSVSLLTIASFAISIFRVWLLAAALGVALGPLEVSGYVGLTTAAALVPVSVGGIGTRDVVSALALQQLGFAPQVGVALSLLILLLNFSQAVAGWIVWLMTGSMKPDAEPQK
ncbi:MAG: lysylphosphatidylglycerol synthase transmembrane domain-containing protein [Chloroflexia bacterium]